ncbi:putative leucine-rich repeat-containing, plant-type, leucine-rich repeat domain superfamily [Helianthus annuus]|nr:putative leucine-rich repeat-containing, plant-type, leucine-rich repeat domain superfamily [Helianthus annuus]
MSNVILLFFFLSLFFISSTSSSSVNTTDKCSVQQTLALLHFKQNLSSINDTVYETQYSYYHPCKDWLGSGYNPVMVNWNKSTDCCDWNGVTCDHSTGDVIGLDLSCGMVQGTIHPNSTLFHLPRLQRLNLAYNDFTDSQLPHDIGRVSNSLTHLNISHCGFTGQVPTDISHLHKLVSLDLSWNRFTGQVPTNISHLHKLVSLDLSSNDLNLEPHVFVNLLQNLTVLKELSLTCVNISAVLPTNLNISSSLNLLNLASTGLHGNPPPNFFSLQSLENLDLSENSLTGHIPFDISLPNLVWLDLSFNEYLLIQPRFFSILFKNSTFLRDLWLRRVNGGSASLPTYINISSLRSLDLTETRLQGTLPDNILSLKHLEDLNLSWNKNLSGPLPKVNTSTSIPLRRLELFNTSLSGEIPTSIGHLKSLIHLNLADCGLNGSLPKSLGNLKYLELLDLSNNKLSGTLPSSLFTLPSLKAIILDKNMFQGNMPLELFSLQSLEDLSLGNNQLTGQIDVLDNGPNLQTFQQLTNLTYIDLSYNNFRGDWELDALLSSLTNLYTLTLSHSGISVTTSNANHYVNLDLRSLSLASCSLKVFPVSIRSMTNLVHLDLSNNDIQGHIPDWIGEIGRNWLSVLDLSNNSITGTIPNVYEDWSEIEGFVLNGNQLQGKVPTSLYKCQKLKIIDLGNNQLSDTFPSWLGDLPKLEALVLRSNNFHGGIVTSSKFKFPFPSLLVLDLSHNGFAGQLPTKYFQNFNAMKNVVKKKTKPEYVFLNEGINYYYSITIVMKGVDQYFPRLSVEYTIVDLSDNKFEGEIPNIIGYLKSLKGLNLSHNTLIGQIPHSLGNISEIESLDLSWNQLTGVIPQSLADLTFLEILNLSQNHLVGRIPQGKQFNTFDGYAFGGNPKLCGFPLPKRCREHLQKPQPEGDVDEEESGFTWKVVMMGYGCGTFLGFVLGLLMLSAGRPKWFIAIANAAVYVILRIQDKRR